MSRSRSSSQSIKSRKSNKQQSNQRDKRRSKSRSSQERRQQNNQSNTCIYIGNLDKRCPQDKLRAICDKYGPYEYCYIVFEPSSHHDRNRDAKVSRGYGFVKYKNQSDAAKALQGLSGLEIMSRKINVEISKRNRPRQSTPGRYLGRRRSPPREHRDRDRDRMYRRRSYSRSSDGDRRRRKHSSERQRKHKDRDRDQKQSKRRDRDRSRSGQKKHRKRRQSRSNSPRK